MPDLHWPPSVSFSPICQAPSEPTPVLLLRISEISRRNWGTSIGSWRLRVMDRGREKSSKFKPNDLTWFYICVVWFWFHLHSLGKINRQVNSQKQPRWGVWRGSVTWSHFNMNHELSLSPRDVQRGAPLKTKLAAGQASLAWTHTL